MTDPGAERLDFFQVESKTFRALAGAAPTPEGLARIRAGLESKYQGVQHLAARALASWIERSRSAAPRERRRSRQGQLRPDGIPEGTTAEWIALLRDWIVLLPLPWWQSVFFAARLVARLVRPDDVGWVLDLYLTMGRPFTRAIRHLPAEACVPRLQELAVRSPSVEDRRLATFALELFEFEGKDEFVQERKARDPDPRARPVRPGVTHDPRRGLGHRRRWK